jgi:hypothetical protein
MRILTHLNAACEVLEELKTQYEESLNLFHFV